MIALVKTNTENEFQIEHRPLPQLEIDEVLIKVDFCGICGSDLHAASHANGYEFVPKPIILGHELVGPIVKLHPDNNKKELLNVRVVVEPALYCNNCEHCLNGQYNICSNIKCLGLHYDGGMAEFVKVKMDKIHRIPESLPSGVAVLTEPLTVAIHAVQAVGKVTDNMNVLVQGCGIIGIFVALAAKNQGAKVTISGLKKDWESRLKYAEQLGIETEIFEEHSNEKKYFDMIFECSGSSIAAEKGIYRLKKGGKLVLVALYEQEVKFPVNIMVRGEINILTSYACSSSDYQKAFSILDKYKNKIQNIVTIYSLKDGPQAFSDARQQKVLKPILKTL
ncbi:zinc-dependent alcohol dehydrogenase [Bacillus sp. FJAT-29937]|uniref:zinc-dependent alcohol dehydrogenase n=1 Tax=Bacillus sp. FJAT-29937 TaxID=1720553 RepID=UPI00083624A0|nr:alcohol dehydrogenase catalytic domain-containing protein [Bacillus sp. FJAT-29937]